MRHVEHESLCAPFFARSSVEFFHIIFRYANFLKIISPKCYLSIVCFYIFQVSNDPILYFVKKIFKIFEKKGYYIF